MTVMKDSTVSAAWIAEMMRVNPPRVLPNGNIFSGPVRLAFANIFEPGKPSTDNPDAEGKYGAALLFPPGTDLAVINGAWLKAAKEGFPRNWDAQGNPVGLHYPIHRQDEKAFGPKPMAGYTQGGWYLNTNSKFPPPVVDGMGPQNPDGTFRTITDKARVYSGVWAFVTMNVYKYANKKTGIGFGLQTVMIIGDDSKLSGGGGNPQTDFAGVTITANANVAEKFGNMPVTPPPMQAPMGNMMPSGGHMGVPGSMPTQPLPQQTWQPSQQAGGMPQQTWQPQESVEDLY